MFRRLLLGVLASPLNGLEILSSKSALANLVKSSATASVVQYLPDTHSGAAECASCPKKAVEFEEVARALDGIIPFYRVENEDLLETQDIVKFPTTRMYLKNRVRTLDNSVGIAEQVYSIMVDVLAKNLGVTTTTTTTKTTTATAKPPKPKSASVLVDLDEAGFKRQVLDDPESGAWFVMFYAPWCGHCKALEPTWKDVAMKLKGKVNVARVDATVEEKLARKYGIQGFPTLLMFPAGKSRSKYQTYQGERAEEALVKFAASFAASPKANQLLSAEQYRASCENGDSARRVCLLAFLPSMEDSSVEERQNYVKMLSRVAAGEYGLELNVMWLEGGGSKQLESKMDLGFGWPAAVVVDAKRQQYTTYKGAFSEAGLQSFMQTLLIGKHPFYPVADEGFAKHVENAAKWDFVAQASKKAKPDEL